VILIARRSGSNPAGGEKPFDQPSIAAPSLQMPLVHASSMRATELRATDEAGTFSVPVAPVS
jgi:hypothetical protein